MVFSSTHILGQHHFQGTYTNEYDTNQSNLSVISPSGNRKIKVTGVHISIDGRATTGYVKLGFADNTVAKVFAGSGTLFSFDSLLIYGEQGGSLKLNSTIGDWNNFVISVNYEEVP